MVLHDFCDSLCTFQCSLCIFLEHKYTFFWLVTQGCTLEVYVTNSFWRIIRISLVPDKHVFGVWFAFLASLDMQFYGIS